MIPIPAPFERGIVVDIWTGIGDGVASEGHHICIESAICFQVVLEERISRFEPNLVVVIPHCRQFEYCAHFSPYNNLAFDDLFEMDFIY